MITKTELDRLVEKYENPERNKKQTPIEFIKNVLKRKIII